MIDIFGITKCTKFSNTKFLKKWGVYMEYIEVSPLPEVCQNCEDRRKCLEEDGCEWCCDERDYLGARFVPAPQGDL